MLMTLISAVSCCSWPPGSRLFLSKQDQHPITALAEAASQVRAATCRIAVNVRAADELGSLWRGFNQMTQELEANSRELDRRRRFIEAILESIPTGVISINADGVIRLVQPRPPPNLSGVPRWNRRFAWKTCFRARTRRNQVPHERAAAPAPPRANWSCARKTATGTCRLRLRRSRKRSLPAFVIVIEDSSELLRAQKAAAWHDSGAARAHEIKNPLTPIRAVRRTHIAANRPRGDGCRAAAHPR